MSLFTSNSTGHDFDAPNTGIVADTFDATVAVAAVAADCVGEEGTMASEGWDD